MADHAAAEEDAKAARQELDELRLTEPAPKQDTVVMLMCAAQKTLEWLEAHSFGPPGAVPPPPALIEQMQDLRGAKEELEAELGLDAATLASQACKEEPEGSDESMLYDKEEEEEEMEETARQQDRRRSAATAKKKKMREAQAAALAEAEKKKSEQRDAASWAALKRAALDRVRHRLHPKPGDDLVLSDSDVEKEVAAPRC